MGSFADILVQPVDQPLKWECHTNLTVCVCMCMHTHNIQIYVSVYQVRHYYSSQSLFLNVKM